MRIRLPAVLTIALVLGSLSAFAQEVPSGTWWRDPGIAGELQLTPDDVQRLDGLYTKSRRRLIDLKNDVEKEQFEYQNLLEKKNLDEKAVNRQFEKLEKARTRLSEERSRFMVEVRKILGYERFQRLKAIYRSRS
jgi:Spy/CpxP family protein refolding chaperone